MNDQNEPQPQFRVSIPPALEGGVYSNFVSVWHTAYEFTLDFSVLQPVQQPEPGSPLVVPCHVTSRVKIPVTLIFDLLRALNDNMTKYEQKFGEITKPMQATEEDE
jgi:hypothetical protein